jgi:hypothetical protein
VLALATRDSFAPPKKKKKKKGNEW